MTDPATGRTRGVPGLNLIMLGLACFVVGLAFDGGFLRGFFLGATVALMVMGTYAMSASRRRGGRGKGNLDDGPWLPSRETGSDPADR